MPTTHATPNDLWPPAAGPSSVDDIERTPLSERGLPESAYELFARAASLWPDRPATSVLADGEHWQTHGPIRLVGRAHAGEVPVAFATVAPGRKLTGQALKAWAAEHVSERAAAPKHVESVDEIPLTTVGKHNKPELRRLAAEQAAREGLAGTATADRVSAALVDGQVEVQVPHSPADAEVGETLSHYAWRWRLV